MRTIEKPFIAVISDIHSNLAALESVLSDAAIKAGGLENIHFVIDGDSISLGPWPKECVERLRTLDGADLIMGNNDRYIIEKLYDRDGAFHTDTFSRIPPGYRENLRWTAAALSKEDLAFVASWKKTAEFEFAGKLFSVSHSDPNDDERIISPLVPDDALDGEFDSADIYVFGHTHRPFIKRTAKRLFINAGSAGGPLDGDPRACWLLVSRDGNGAPRPEIVRTSYDIGSAAAAMRERNVPWREALELSLRHARL